MPAEKMLQGKCVLVTGASRGIGETIACTLARHGAKLLLVSEQGDELTQAQEKCRAEGGAECQCYACDLADPQAVQALADQLAGQGVDVAIMNAGVFVGGDNDPLQGNPDDWERMFKVNVGAPMRLVRTLAPKMVDKGSGVIISISDVEAVHSGPKHAAYSASKYALRGFFKSAYEALRDKNVKVLSIAAGNVGQTAMAEQTGKQGGQGTIDPNDVAEAVLLPFRVSANCVPEEIVLKAVQPSST